MSDAPKPTPPADAPKKRRLQGKWSRRLAWTFGILLALSVLFRVVLPMLFPVVLRHIASGYNLDADYERSEINLMSGDVGLWHLTLTPKGTTTPIFEAGYVRGNISTLKLLTLTLEVWRVEADGVDLTVERDEQGHIPLIEQFLASSSVAKTAASTTTAPTKFDLTPPLRIDALRLSRVRTVLRDKSVNPPFQTEATMNLRLSDVGSTKRPMNFEMVLLSDDLVDQLRVQGTAKGTASQVDATGAVVVRGLDLEPISAYLAPFGIKPVSRSISMAGTGKFKIATTQQSDALSVAIDFADMKIESEGASSATVKQVALSVDALSATSAKVSKILVDGVTANAARSPEGDLRFSGIQLIPTNSSPTTQPSSPLDFRVIVDELKVQNVALGFNDSGVTPAAKLGLNVDELTLRNIVLDPADPNATMQIAGKMHAPGIAGAITLGGNAKPGADLKTAQLKVGVTGIKPDAIQPYLAAFGLQSLLKDATFGADIQTSFKMTPNGANASAKISNVKLADGNDLLAMPNVFLDAISVDTSTGMLEVGTIQLTGPTLSAQREANGAVQLLGLRFTPGSIPKKAATTNAIQIQTPDTAAVPSTLPRLRIGHFDWKDIKLQFVDHTVSPPSSVSLADAGIEINDLLLDLQSKQTAKPGQLKAWIAAPNFADRVDITGTFSPAPSALDTTFNVTGSGITLAVAAPYLKTIGIEPVLQNGQLKLTAVADLKQTNGQLDVQFALKEVAFNDADKELIGLDALSVKNFSVGKELAVDAIQVDRPRASLVREKDGNFRLAGIHTITLPPSTQPVVPEDPNAPLLPQMDIKLPPIIATIKALALNDAQIQLTDEMASSPVTTIAHISTTLNDFAFGKDAAPGKFDLKLKADGAIDSLTVSGDLLASPAKQQIHANVVGSGVRAGPLASYLPPAVTATIKDGRIAASLDASIFASPQGGSGANLIVSKVNYADADQTLFKLDSFKVLVPRYDPKGGIVQIDEVSSAGLTLDGKKTAEGAVELLGMALKSLPTTQPVEVKAESPATQPMIATTAPATEDVSAIVARARRALPMTTLTRLDLNVDHIGFADGSRPESSPVAIANLKIANLAPIELGGKNPESLSPVKLQITGKVDPVIGAINVAATATPFAQQPSIQADVLLSGINGDGLIKLAPELKNTLDASALTTGEFKTHLEATTKLQRRGPYDFDFTKGFDLDLLIKDINYRAAPDSQVLIGLEQLQSEGIRVEPAKGNLIVKSLELTKPIARATREKDGIHLLGLVVKLPTPATQPTDAQATPAPAEVVVTTEAPAIAKTRPSNEIRIDKFLVSGADIVIEDRSAEPAMIVPINNLDLEVRGLSNQAFYEERPIKFNLLVNSAKTPLPKRIKGAIDENNLEDRELFAQVASSGNIILYPKLSGWAKTSVNSFEILSLRGPASVFGVNIGGGLYDSTIDARINDQGKIDLRTRHVVTDLAMTEAPDGPIGKSLKLPSPLNVVIGALEDPDGSLTLPVNVSVDQGEIKGIGGAATGAVSSVILTAIASAPVKVVGGMTGLIGLTGKKGKPIEPVVISFAPGDTTVQSSELKKLDIMLAALKKEKNAELTIKGDIGGGDVERAALRANPPVSDASGIASSLRTQKMQLLQQRSELAGTARAQLAASSDQSQHTLSQLRQVDRQLAQTEDALDNIYDLLRPGADKQAPRRTKAAALQLADERLDAMKSAIVSYATIPADSEKLRVIHPTFSPAEGDAGGTITITLVAKKNQK